MTGTILITGAGGFTGRHACRHFNRQGYTVAAAVRREDGGLAEGRTYRCDMTSRTEVAALVEQTNPDYVLHLAGRNAVPDSWKDPVGCMESNVLSTLYLLEAARGRSGCRLLVAGSMLGFDLAKPPEPLHPYSLAKTVQVLVARAWGHLFPQEVLIAEPSNLIGPGPSNGICGLLANRIARWEQGDTTVFKLSSGHEERDYLDVRDAVAAYQIILEKGVRGTVYPVCSGTWRSLGEIARTYTALAAVPLPIETGLVPVLPRPKAMETALMAELGWTPVIPFEQSLQDALEYARQSV